MCHHCKKGGQNVQISEKCATNLPEMFTKYSKFLTASNAFKKSYNFPVCHSGEHRPTVGDIMMSFLPLAHMLERCCENAMYYSGGSVGFYSGDIKELTNDLKALRPTVMPAVPRLLNRVYDKIQAELSRSGLKRMLFNMALRSKEAEIKRGILRRDSIWDRIVFKKVQAGWFRFYNDCVYYL